jgi:molybdopterin converting factor small subunit
VITLKFGCQELKVEAEGRSVEELIDETRGILNLAGNESARLNNDGTVGSDYVPKDGDVVELVKAAGSKG